MLTGLGSLVNLQNNRSVGKAYQAEPWIDISVAGPTADILIKEIELNTSP